MVSVPTGATEPRPIVVVLHGDGGRPEPHCEIWRRITGATTFVLCPRGQALPPDPSGQQRYTFPDPDRTQAELRAGLAALKARFGRHVAPGPVVLVGVGSAVVHVCAVMQQDPSFFTRVVLVGGPQHDWSSTQAATFATRGGQRVLFVCLDTQCRKRAERNVLFTERAGALARHAHAPRGTRGSDPALAEVLEPEWSWLIEGDPRYPK